MAEPASPEPDRAGPAVVAWGDERPGPIDRLAGRWWHPAVPQVLAGLGAAALFGSLVGEWQVWAESPIGIGSAAEPESLSIGIGEVMVWGMGWLVGATLLAACTLLALSGREPVRGHARMVGLAIAGAEVLVLAGAAVNLSRSHLLALGSQEADFSPGRGFYAAVASVVLLAAALYTSRLQAPQHRQAGSGPAAPEPAGGPEDLAVGPAEPLNSYIDLGDDRERN